MVQILLNKAAADIGAAHPHPQHASKRVRNKRVQKRVWAAGVLAQARAVPAGRRAYSEHDGGRQEKRAGTAPEEKRWGRQRGWVAAGAEHGFAPGAERPAFKASFSSRASRAISLTASNSSRLTTSRSRKMRSAWLRNMVSNSRRTPEATPAASFISRAISSKKRLLVWVIAGLGFA